MADPFRLRVLKQLSTLIAGITPVNGYQHDLSAAVFRGRDVFGEGDPLPMVSILEPVRQDQVQPGPGGSALQKAPWELLLQGFVLDDRDNPTDPAHLLMAEVKLAIAKEMVKNRGRDILGMGGRVTQIILGQGIVRPADEISGKAYFWLSVFLDLAENNQDPYA